MYSPFLLITEIRGVMKWLKIKVNLLNSNSSQERALLQIWITSDSELQPTRSEFQSGWSQVEKISFFLFISV